MYDYSKTLNPQKALIWRIVHRDNVPWILDHGLHCGNSAARSPNWVHIGNQELIKKRSYHPVPVGKKGVLNDYVPFYFTPFSPMMKNINTGYGGIRRRANEEIVILVSSLHKVHDLRVPFVFTDGHAYYGWSDFYTDLKDLDQIDWSIIQTRDFRRDPNDPAKFERYQAEALVYQHCPIEALIGMICYTDEVKHRLETVLHGRNLSIPVYSRPGWYFR